MAQTSSDSGWRGSREAWLQAAYEMLLESGVDSVKILPLAERLRLSRTSFYWFFKNREELLAALVTRWKELNTRSLVKSADAYAETIVEAMLNVFDCWHDSGLFDSRLEYAVRSWALRTPEIQSELREADEQRLDALRRMFRRFGHETGIADVRARTVYLVQIGYISMQTEESLAVRMKRVPNYVKIFTGQAPERKELDRFYARHGFRG